MRDIQQSITTNFGADFQSSKEPKFSGSVVQSSSRMSISSTSRSNLGWPMNVRSESCLQYERGHWNYEANCIFSHGEVTNKARLCWFFMDGKICPYGNRRQFLHQRVNNVKEGSAVGREMAAVTVVNIGAGERARKENDELVCKRKWKTRLCNRWERNASCPYGERCQYAHGETELQRSGLFPPPKFGEKSFHIETLAGDAENASMKETRNFDKQQKRKSWLIKWSSVEKISHVYADWIESTPYVPPGSL